MGFTSSNLRDSVLRWAVFQGSAFWNSSSGQREKLHQAWGKEAGWMGGQINWQLAHRHRGPTPAEAPLLPHQWYIPDFPAIPHSGMTSEALGPSLSRNKQDDPCSSGFLWGPRADSGPRFLEAPPQGL